MLSGTCFRIIRAGGGSRAKERVQVEMTENELCFWKQLKLFKMGQGVHYTILTTSVFKIVYNLKTPTKQG